MKAVFLLELKELLRGMKVYIYSAAMLLLEGFFITYVNFYKHYSALEYSLEFIVIALMFMLPVICADIFTKDRKKDFKDMYFSLDISAMSVIFGKLFACLTAFTASYLPLFAAPFVFMIFGEVNLLSAFLALLGYFVFAIAIISLYVFISSVAKRKIHSYIACYVCAGVIYLSGAFSALVPQSVPVSLILLSLCLAMISVIAYIFTKAGIFTLVFFAVSEGTLILFSALLPIAFSGAFSAFLDFISPTASFSRLVYGTFDLTALWHMLIFAAVFIFLTAVQLEKEAMQGGGENVSNGEKGSVGEKVNVSREEKSAVGEKLNVNREKVNTDKREESLNGGDKKRSKKAENMSRGDGDVV